MNIYDFADEMIQTRDLDPVYCVLSDAQLDPDQLDRWLFAYFCFYHVGAASSSTPTTIGIGCTLRLRT